MPRMVTREERRLVEKVLGSDIWWIRYKIDGVGAAQDGRPLRRCDQNSISFERRTRGAM